VGPRPQVHGGLFDAAVHLQQAALDHHHAIGHAEQGVAQDDGEHAALGPTKDVLCTHEQQQQRQADDHLGHDQRRVHHAREDGAAQEAPVAHQHEGGKGGKHGRQHAGRQRHLERQPEAVDDLGVVQQGLVPAQRKPGEARVLPGAVEAEHDHEQQRQVQEGEHQRQPELAEVLFEQRPHGLPPSLRSPV